MENRNFVIVSQTWSLTDSTCQRIRTLMAHQNVKQDWSDWTDRLNHFFFSLFVIVSRIYSSSFTTSKACTIFFEHDTPTPKQQGEDTDPKMDQEEQQAQKWRFSADERRKQIHERTLRKNSHPNGPREPGTARRESATRGRSTAQQSKASTTSQSKLERKRMLAIRGTATKHWYVECTSDSFRKNAQTHGTASVQGTGHLRRRTPSSSPMRVGRMHPALLGGTVRSHPRLLLQNARASSWRIASTWPRSDSHQRICRGTRRLGPSEVRTLPDE